GTITFVLSGPGGFSYTQTDTVSGNGTYTAGDTLPTTGQVAGTYTWSAHYSGDANNVSANDQGGTAEQTIVRGATPSLITTPNAASIGLGGTATDTATLSGGYFPSGSITFTLTNTDTSTVVFTNTVTGVSGNNSYMSGGYTVTVAGHYQWAATYNGDGNNNTAIESNP